MLQILTIITLTFFTIVSALLLLSWQIAKREETSLAEEFTGICATIFENRAQKEGNKSKIVDLLRDRQETNQAQIRQVLGLPRASVVRYMNELEQEEGVERVEGGDKTVSYVIKHN